MSDSSAAWGVLLGKAFGPLQLGVSTDDVSKIEVLSDPKIVQDELAAVSDYEQLLNSMGPDSGLDPDEFKDLFAAMKLETTSEVKWVPIDKSLPVLFFRDNILVSIIISAECRPNIEGRSVFDMPAKEFLEMMFTKSRVVFRRRNEIVAPHLALRFTLPKKVDFQDGKPIELLVLEENNEAELIAAGYKELSE